VHQNPLSSPPLPTHGAPHASQSQQAYLQRHSSACDSRRSRAATQQEMSQEIVTYALPQVLVTDALPQTCGYCGAAPGSHTLSGKMRQFRRCARCKQADYCSEKCQRKHWKQEHMSRCTQQKLISPHTPSPPPSAQPWSSDTIMAKEGAAQLPLHKQYTKVQNTTPSPRITPSAESNQTPCVRCGAAPGSVNSKGTPREFRRCQRCLAADYCSEKCQQRHWETQHRAECTSGALVLPGAGLCETQKIPTHTQRESIQTQKSPTQTQKSPIHTQKSPIHTQKSPMDMQKSSTLTQKSPTDTYKSPMDTHTRLMARPCAVCNAARPDVPGNTGRDSVMQSHMFHYCSQHCQFAHSTAFDADIQNGPRYTQTSPMYTQNDPLAPKSPLAWYAAFDYASVAALHDPSLAQPHSADQLHNGTAQNQEYGLRGNNTHTHTHAQATGPLPDDNPFARLPPTHSDHMQMHQAALTQNREVLQLNVPVQSRYFKTKHCDAPKETCT